MEETLKYQKIWENLNLPKDCNIERQSTYNPMIFIVVSGKIRISKNNDEVQFVSSHEMFMAQIDNSYTITLLEQTRLLICHVPLDAWYEEQKWIDELIPDNFDKAEKFLKLPVKNIIIRFLSLLDFYYNEGILLKNNIRPLHFLELKRQEFFFLLFSCYSKNDLTSFLQCVLSNDMQFKKIVVNNYFHAKNVQELAKLANYSTSGFIKKFQKCFNDSPYKWMQKQKAKQISMEINRGTKSLQEIASEYKFSSYQHFSVFCKAQLGAPPSKIVGKSKFNNE